MNEWIYKITVVKFGLTNECCGMNRLFWKKRGAEVRMLRFSVSWDLFGESSMIIIDKTAITERIAVLTEKLCILTYYYYYCCCLSLIIKNSAIRSKKWQSFKKRYVIKLHMCKWWWTQNLTAKRRRRKRCHLYRRVSETKIFIVS